jgi:hypothetical protein
MRHVLFAGLAILSACTQSGQVFEPTNNRAVTATTTPATYTFTLNINITTLGANHQNKPFSALLFRDGTLVAAQYNSGATAGTDMTSGAGAATLVMNGVDTNGCPTATPAALETGSYDLYFAVQYGAETVTITNPNGACGASGWIQSSTAGGNLYGVKATAIMVSGNTTFNISNTNLAQFRQHTFQFSSSQWQTSRIYTVGTFVHEAGSIYRVILEHTSGVFATDLGASRLAIVPVFAGGSGYAAGQYVYASALSKVLRVVAGYTSTASAQDDLNAGHLQESATIKLGYSQYACFVGDLDATAYSTTMQPLSVYTRAGDGTTTGAGGVTHLLAVGTYKYFCSGGADTNHFQSGDSQATGTFTVTHTGVTTLNSAAFTVIP